MIPAGRLNPRAVGSLMEYLRHEIWQAETQRRPLEEKWLRYHQLYKCVPDTEVKDFPFAGAANFVVPVIATDVDTIYSRLMGILFGPDNLYTCRALRPDMVQFAARLQEFLQWAQQNELGIYEAVSDFVLDLCKLGTGVLKQRYRREMKRVYQFRESDYGTIEEHPTILLHDHPQVDWVSLFDFLVPTLTTNDIQQAPWVAEKLRLTWGQLMSRARNGVYDPAAVNRLAAWRTSNPSHVQKTLLGLDKLQVTHGDIFTPREVWLDYDITGVDGPEAIVCTIHEPSMTYLRIDYNPFFNQEKPYSVARYLRQEGKFYGIGLAEMLEQTQEEVTTTRRQRTDNSTLSNAPMMIALNGIGIREDEPIIPGRWVLVNEMNNVQALNMGRPIDTTQFQEQTSLAYASRRTGVNDYISGEFSPAMGYSTASVGVQNLREAAKRFDQTMREIRTALAETGTRVVELYQQFNQSGKEFLAMGDVDGAQVHAILQFPMDMIRAGVGIELTATSAAFNKDVEIRTNMIIMQQLNQFYQQGIQAMGIVLNPQVPEPIRAMAWMMVSSGALLLRRILDSYGMQDTDRLIPEMEALVNGRAQQLNTFGGPGAAPAGLGQGGIGNGGVPLLGAGMAGAVPAGGQAVGAGF